MATPNERKKANKGGRRANQKQPPRRPLIPPLVPPLLPECPAALIEPVWAFLQGVRDDPPDDTARLVFADWLEEHAEHEPALATRAELIRVGCRLNAALGPPTLEDGDRDLEDFPAPVRADLLRELTLIRLLDRGAGWVTLPGAWEKHGRFRGAVSVAPRLLDVTTPALMNDRGFPGCVWAPLSKLVSASGDGVLPVLPVTAWYAPEFEPVKLVRPTHLTADGWGGEWWCYSPMLGLRWTIEDSPFKVPQGVFRRLLREAGLPGTAGIHVRADCERVAFHASACVSSALIGYRTRKAARDALAAEMAALWVCAGGVRSMFVLAMMPDSGRVADWPSAAEALYVHSGAWEATVRRSAEGGTVPRVGRYALARYGPDFVPDPEFMPVSYYYE